MRGFPGDWKLPLLRLPSPGWVSVPSSFVSLFIFYILSYLPSKTMGCFSGHLMSSASDQKLFCEICSVFNCSFHEFVGEKVVSPSKGSILCPLHWPVESLPLSYQEGHLFVKCNINYPDMKKTKKTSSILF